MSPKKADHGMTVVVKAGRLQATCTCGRWLRTTKNDDGGQDRLATWFVQHVTGSNKL